MSILCGATGSASDARSEGSVVMSFRSHTFSSIFRTLSAKGKDLHLHSILP
jgi:hypothetical protein